MKVLLATLVLTSTLSAKAMNQCPVGYEKENYNTQISDLKREHLIMINNESPINGDGTFSGTSLFTRNGILRINFKEKLSTKTSIEAHAPVKITASLKSWDLDTCGLLGGQCLIVDHPHIKSIQIDSKEDKKIKDLRLAGIIVCKESGSSLAARNVDDSDRSIAGNKSQYEPNYKASPSHKEGVAQ